MIFYDANSPGPNPVTVRLFILERGGLDLKVKTIDLANLQNRSRSYREQINSRGEVPALGLDNGNVLTEITAVCEYLDEAASEGRSLIGETAEQRGMTRMWTRRVDMEIAQPLTEWWRGTPEAEDFYRGHRILMPEAQRSLRLRTERGLNQLDEDLAETSYLGGQDICLADILLYAFMATVGSMVPWSGTESRRNVSAWFKRMSERPASKEAIQPFKETF